MGCLTSLNEGDYFRIVALAVGATRYVEQMAEKNILKMIEMIEMAKQGWAATGNAPYGTDLVCYPIHDLTKPLFRVVRLRYKAPHLYRTLYADGREEVSERMPPRDKKATGYRFEPSICEDRLQAVRLMYELYDSGMGFTDISEALWKQGFKHYDKPFGYHGVETILSNPVYIGEPAWGKLGVGAYYILHDGQPKKVRRKASDTLAIKKAEGEYTRPLKPIFPPIVQPDLWQRVHDQLAERAHVNQSFGKRRTKSRAKHPLNGKLFCPDCGEPMVFGSTMSRGKTNRYYICGTYRKTQRKQCRANSIPGSKIDKAIETLVATVRDRLAALTTAEPKVAETVLKEQWAKETELGRLIYRIVNIAFHQTDSELLNDESERNEDIFDFVKGQLADGKHPTAGGNEGAGTFDEEKGEWIGWDIPTFLSLAFEFYNRSFEKSVKGLRKEFASIDAELARIAKAIMDGIPSETVRRNLNVRMGELEGRKRELEPRLVPLTGTAQALIDQLHAIRETVEQTDTVAKAKRLDSFVERVVPHFHDDAGQRKERDISFEFVPMHAARNVLPEPMKVRSDCMGNALFHLLASLFSLDVPAALTRRKDIPVDEIRQLRALGRSVAEIARKTGATVITVRRIVGKLDPAEMERRRKEQEATAARIDACSEPWSEKVRRWKAETGPSGGTLFRIIKRMKERRPQNWPGAWDVARGLLLSSRRALGRPLFVASLSQPG